jgi:hypothetical protein
MGRSKGENRPNEPVIERQAEPLIRACTDCALPLAELPDVAELAIEERMTNAPMRRLADVPPEHERVRMAIQTGKAWRPGRTLRIRFLDGAAGVRSRVRDVAAEWMDHANVRLSFGDDPDAEIRISFKQAGSWSYLGTEALGIAKDKPTMNLGWLKARTRREEYSRVVLHEFGHALACVHEHQSPAAGIPWDREAVYRYYMRPPNRWSRTEVDKNIFEAYDRSHTQFTKFDVDSIMVYPIPKELTVGGFEVDWNLALSETDKRFIAGRYPFKDQSIRELPVGVAVEGVIDTSAAENHYQFEMTAPGEIVLETSGMIDVVMALYGPNSQTRLAEDDDSGLGQNAKIETVLMEGNYLVRVRHKRPTGTGTYLVTLRRRG